MHQSIGPEGLNRAYSPKRKRAAIYYWRRSNGCVFYDNVREHEMQQWSTLLNAHGRTGLRLGYGSSMEHLRSAPAPTLSVRADFARSKNGETVRVNAVLDGSGQPIEEPFELTPQELLMYHVVRELTLTNNVCTYADLAHSLWPADVALPNFQIIAVLAHHINKKLDPAPIVNVRGRGFRLRLT